jgi:hypothetical protein
MYETTVFVLMLFTLMALQELKEASFTFRQFPRTVAGMSVIAVSSF